MIDSDTLRLIGNSILKYKISNAAKYIYLSTFIDKGFFGFYTTAEEISVKYSISESEATKVLEELKNNGLLK